MSDLPLKEIQEKRVVRWFLMFHQAKMWHRDDLASSIGRVLFFPLYIIIKLS
jgi:hypothetical protein